MNYRFRMHKLALIVAITAIILQCGIAASAATITWTGNAGDSLFTTATNWNTDTVPAGGDTALINLADASVNLDTTVTTTNITLTGAGATALTVKSGGVANITGATSMAIGGNAGVATLTVKSGGSIIASGNILVNSWSNSSNTKSDIVKIAGNVTVGSGYSFWNGDRGSAITTQTAGTLTIGDGLNINVWYANDSLWVAHESGNLGTQMGDCVGTYNLNGGKIVTPLLGLAWAGTATGTFNLNGGTLVTTAITGSSGYSHGGSIFNFNGGTLQMAVDSSDLFGIYYGDWGYAVDSVTIKTGGGKIDTAGHNVTINRDLVCAEGASSDGGLTKLGAGSLILNGANSFMGALNVQAGTLNYYGSNINGHGFAVNGGTLSGNTLGGAIKLNSGVLNPSSGSSSLATMTGTDLVTTGGAITLQLRGTTTAASDAISLSGAAVLGSATVLDVKLVNQILGAGDYNIISASGGLTSAISSLPTFDITDTRISSYSWKTTSTALMLTAVGEDAKSLTWHGDSGTSAIWHLRGDSVWQDAGGHADKFFRGDNVVFDNNGTADVTVTGTVSPINMTVAGTQDYDFSGAGKMYVTGDFAKTSTGDLTIETTGGNVFANNVVVNSTAGGSFRLIGSGVKTFQGDLNVHAGDVTLTTTSTSARNSIAGNISVDVASGTYSFSKMDVGGTIQMAHADPASTGSYAVTLNSVTADYINIQTGSLTINGDVTSNTAIRFNDGALAINANVSALGTQDFGGDLHYSFGFGNGSIAIASGKSLSTAGQFLLGYGTNSTAVLNLSNTTGIVSVDSFRLGQDSGGYAALNLSGTQSVHTTATSFIGTAGASGLVTIRDNASFTLDATGTADLDAGVFLGSVVGTGSTGMILQTGGSFTIVDQNRPDAAGYENRLILGHETGSGIYNLQGGLLSTPRIQLGFCPSVGVLNLNGGTCSTGQISVGILPAWNSPGEGIVNFNGGVLKATANNDRFMKPTTGSTSYGDAGVDQVYVYAGGAKIDTNGYDIGISANLEAPSGYGVSSVVISSGGSGYASAPIVTISGGNGTTLATGYATISGGAVTGVVVTGAGAGFAAGESLSVSFLGGGGSGAAGSAVLAENISGGLDKYGDGILNLSGQLTYAGDTTVHGGVLRFSATNVALNGSVIVENGAGVVFGTAYSASAPAEVPEPSTFVLLALAGFGAWVVSRKR